jgi:Fe-S-cluster containining protein
MEDIEQLIPDGYCMRCRGCCRFSRRQGPWLVHLLDAEKGLRDKIGIVEHAVKEEAPFRCSSLDADTNACAIYGFRPFECRLYPFVLNRKDSRFFLSVDRNCPYVKEQEHSETFTAYAARLAVWLRKAETRTLLRENSAIFQPYPDVCDIAELAM